MVTDGLPWLSKQKGKNQGMTPRKEVLMLPAGLTTGSVGSRLQHMEMVPQGFQIASVGISLD